MPKSTPKPKRAIASALEESTHPPPSLQPGQTIAKLCKAEGNHLYSVILPKDFKPALDKTSDESEILPGDGVKAGSGAEPSCLVELTSALRGAVFFRRNGYVLVDTDRELLGGRENKIVGIVVGVVLGRKEEKEWRAMEYWPEEFRREKGWDYGDEDDDGPRMPSSDDD